MSKPKLYLFAIGGTGSRVLKSLTMLLASGIKTNTEKIIPMIIDTDINNGDVEKCRKLIQNYNKIHTTIYTGVPEEEDQGHFFRTKIMPPKEMNISGTDYGTLKDMVDYNSLSSKKMEKTKALFDLLYSNANKDMPLEKGFLGNPNVGSVVLKNVVESSEFKEFTQDFKQNDRIFIISSIFGGTGAAGFPLLMNVFRDENSGMNNKTYINNAIIGGVSVLPYFQVDVEKFNSGDSAINSSTFITKTKAALSYYNRNLKQLVNTMFYVGDTRQSNYENFDGGIEQKNPANFIELTAASSVLEFLEYEPNAGTKEDLSQTSRFFEYGVNQDSGMLHLKQLKGDEYIKQFIHFHYYNIYVSNYMKDALTNDKLAWKNELKLSNNYEKQPFFKNLESFTNHYYYRWLLELALEKHDRKFLPFDLSIISNKGSLIKDVSGTLPAEVTLDEKKLFTLVTGIHANNNSSFFKKDKIKYDEEFSKIAKSIAAQPLGNRERTLSTLLNQGISNIIDNRFSL
ncbi:hypothetical protein IWQ47_003506 [Aquimarina sp. EL_43]|uniref:hypothetical protein n=1 Tax=unclassified Aquimarina TaxID=2627091 RepID=UPI0018C969F6|nr:MULTISPECIES: hypothetical protein [unclassified Aquimarina]MBG6131752.1 hypothetical protein [Aquimarina sp. EL_35]MBG6149316.1 hypothetical protein [Aquimarina sp. EL_32]MBG6170421.1 hypothetical protein [Aquimarina sp. EL_43]